MGGERRIDIRILGTTRCFVDAEPVPLAAKRRRQILTELALVAPAAVSADRLIDSVWGPERAGWSVCG